MDDMPQGKRTVGDKEILEWMRDHNDPAFTTQEVAQSFEMTTEGIRGRLKTLHAEGKIHAKKPTARTVIWWSDVDHDHSALDS